MQLNIEPLKLQNAAGGALEGQFQDALGEIAKVQEHAEDFETSKGKLKFEIVAKVTVEMDPATGESLLGGQVTLKGPKRKARAQMARLHESRLIVDVQPIPEQKIMNFSRAEKAQN